MEKELALWTPDWTSQVSKRRVVGKKEFAKGCEAIGFEGLKRVTGRSEAKILRSPIVNSFDKKLYEP